jgi:BirA family biotin operon repressor/biotin-[acetyl-CoA-carboxylase] ligase
MIIGKKIIHYNEIDSTNDEAKRLIKRGLGEGAIIIAGSQSGGRGKPGSGWFSPPQVGLYLSAIVKPYKNPKDLSPITLLGANAVINTINKLTGQTASIKPPNDVILNGKKICGVLVERVASGQVIIGIGVNINTPITLFVEDLRNSSTSLKIENNRDFDLQEFIDILIPELDELYLAYLGKI